MRRLLVTLPLSVSERAALDAALPGVEVRAAAPPIGVSDVRWADTVLGNVAADTLISATGVTWIHSPSVGLDAYVPVRTARPDLRITNSSGVMDDAVSEHALLLLLALARQLHWLTASRAARRWDRETYVAQGRPTVIAGKQVFVLGSGPIGRTLVRKLVALGCQVTVFRRSAAPSMDGACRTLAFRDLPAVVAEADALIGVLPSTPETDGLLDRATIALMRPGAWVINVGRGSLIDEPALVEALVAGRLGGAALDVFATEPLPPESPLWTLPTVILTPHVAGRFDAEMAGHVASFLDLAVAGRS